MTTNYDMIFRIMGGYYGYGMKYDEDTMTCSDGEVEYQIRGYGADTEDSEFRSILVRFCQDETHSYQEFFLCDYSDYTCPEEVLLEDAFSETTLDRISMQMRKKRRIL